MDVRQLRKDVHAGRVSTERLLELVLELDGRLRRIEAELGRMKARLAQYEPPATEPSTEPLRSPDQYSLAAEERRRRGRRRRRQSSGRGRRPTAEKLAQAERTETVCPEGFSPAGSTFVNERPVWRIERGRAVRVAYRFYKQAWSNTVPTAPGVLPNCEFGHEILVLLAYLVYIVRVSLDQACELLGFFCELPLSKSQADALLNRLAREWEQEFEHLCDLVALAAVVSMDETGWKVFDRTCSLWAFLSPEARVFVFGCRKDADALDTMLPPEVFEGVAVSDDAAVYGRFTRAQKCWAHLLRKAIRLSLLYPESDTYRQFLDDLLALYRDGKRIAADGRFSRAGRERKTRDLEDRLWTMCRPHAGAADQTTVPHEQEFFRLVAELLRLMAREELFTFVLEPAVPGTNNETERELRGPAQDRKTCRTSRSRQGARRRSVITSVLESLRVNLPEFNLRSVSAEIRRWTEAGMSLFAERLRSLGRADPSGPRLDVLIP